MQINSSMNLNISSFQKEVGIKPLYTQKVEDNELKELKQKVFENSHAFTFSLSLSQSTVVSKATQESEDDFQNQYEEFQKMLDDIGYNGKKIAELSQEEAKELVSEDGFFGIKQTSKRIADFVIQGANGDEKLLRAGLEGIQQDFEEAEKMWGAKLPEISYKTIDAAKEMIQKEMARLGYSILDQNV